MPEPFLVGVDVGTTRIKAVAFDLHGAELAGVATPTRWDVHGAYVDADARRFADGARDVIADVVRQVGDAGTHGDVAGVGITGMAESGVLLDEHGEPVSPIVAWHDPRGDVDHVLAELPDFCVRTGLPAITVPSIFKLPMLLADAGGRAVRWLNVPEWIVRSLGGDEVAEMSLAGRTGLQDLHTAGWWPDAFAYLGVDDSILPGEARLGTEGAGRASIDPVVGAALAVAGHDHQVAAFAAQAMGPTSMFDSLGTAEAVIRVVAMPVRESDVAELTALGRSVGRTVIADHAAVTAGFRTGQTLERISRLLGCSERSARHAMSKRALDQPPSSTLAIEIIDGQLSISGIGDDDTPEMLWHAAVAGADAEVATAIERFDALFGAATNVVIGGGWLHDPLVSHIKDARFVGHRRTTMSEPGAAGAAAMAGIYAGLLEGPFTGD